MSFLPVADICLTLPSCVFYTAVRLYASIREKKQTRCSLRQRSLEQLSTKVPARLS